jgi:hypothetical protein
MKKTAKKLVLKKATVKILAQQHSLMAGGTSRVCSIVTGCAGTAYCCQPTK